MIHLKKVQPSFFFYRGFIGIFFNTTDFFTVHLWRPMLSGEESHQQRLKSGKMLQSNLASNQHDALCNEAPVSNRPSIHVKTRALDSIQHETQAGK